MKNKNGIPSIVGGFVGFLAGWCAAFCMITGFRLTVDHPEQIWMVCGLVLLVCTFLPSEIGAMFVLPAILIVCLVPTIYSYRLAKKKGQI